MGTNVSHTLRLTLLLLIGCGLTPGWAAEEAGAPPPRATKVLAHAEAELLTARKRSAIKTTNSVAAWELGRACFAWGNLLKTPAEREKIYSEGIAACRRSLRLDPDSAAAHYYLGMNIGRIADLKRNLAAFRMVKEVERSFKAAARLDEKFSHAGPDRNLGLLYQHAPGWPISVGNNKLARQHLERAVKLAPNYPENRLNLAEAYQEWREPELFQQELDAIQALWPIAKTNFTGVAWETDWAEWDSRKRKLLPEFSPEP